MDMEITFIENIARIRLKGRLDTPGVDQVEAKLTASVVPGGKNTVVDLSQVSFVASTRLCPNSSANPVNSLQSIGRC